MEFTLNIKIIHLFPHQTQSKKYLALVSIREPAFIGQSDIR